MQSTFWDFFFLPISVPVRPSPALQWIARQPVYYYMGQIWDIWHMWDIHTYCSEERDSLCMCVRVCVHCACAHVCICVCVLSLSLCACVHVCMWVHIYRVNLQGINIYLFSKFTRTHSYSKFTRVALVDLMYKCRFVYNVYIYYINVII